MSGSLCSFGGGSEGKIHSQAPSGCWQQLVVFTVGWRAHVLAEFFSAPGGCTCSLACEFLPLSSICWAKSSLYLESLQLPLLPHFIDSPLVSTLLSVSSWRRFWVFKDSSDYTGPIWKTQENLFKVHSLDSICKAPFIAVPGFVLIE